MAVSRNLISSFTSSIWSAALRILVVPLYLKYLGIGSYGLVGFYSTTQALFQVLDFGMAPTLSREVARCLATGRLDVSARLLRTFGVVSWVVAAVIALVMTSSAPVIATRWLNPGRMPRGEVVHAVALMGVAIACRWPIGVYQGSLNGEQRITTVSLINIVMTSISVLGSIVVLAFISSSLAAFFAWQAIAGLLQAQVLRVAAWNSMRNRTPTKFDVSLIRSTWKFSASMLALSAAGVVFAQLDKVLLSKLLTLADFGVYMLATVAVAAANVVITPFYNSLYPRFSAYVASGNFEDLMALYRKSGRLMAAILVPIAVMFGAFSYELLALWTGRPTLSRQAAPIASLLGLGTALHGIMYIPNALQLSFGKVSVPLVTNGVLLVIMVPVTVVLAMRYGAIGGALAWTILHSLYALLNVWLQDRFVYRGSGCKWLFRDAGPPFAIGLISMPLALTVAGMVVWPAGIRIGAGCAICGAIFGISIATSHDLRHHSCALVRQGLERLRGNA